MDTINAILQAKEALENQIEKVKLKRSSIMTTGYWMCQIEHILYVIQGERNFQHFRAANMFDMWVSSAGGSSSLNAHSISS